jgi:hypothetical protein
MSTEAAAAPQATGNPPAPAPTQQPAPAAAPAVAKPVLPGSKAWAEMTAEQRHAQLRGPENPRARGYSPARDQREAAAARSPGEAPASADQQQAPPADGTKFKVGKFEVSEGEFGAMMERQAADDLRATQRPASPADYRIELKDALPAGVDFRFDESDPASGATLDAARQWAHAKGLSQSEFGELLGMYANGKVAEQTVINRAAAAERGKLGALGGQRVDAVTKWIRGEAGDANAKIIVAGLACAAQVEFMEKIMTRLTNQGSASFSQSHRVPPDTGGIPGYENMSFSQKRFAQDQIAAARRNSR